MSVSPTLEEIPNTINLSRGGHATTLPHHSLARRLLICYGEILNTCRSQNNSREDLHWLKLKTRKGFHCFEFEKII
jgi:hypothetical protein